MSRKAVISPPVITPSEVPAGAFILAAGLAARGIEAPIHDLSLGFFRWLFLEHAPQAGLPNCSPSLNYLISPSTEFYDPHKHRSVCGVLQSVLKSYSKDFPGWHLSLMDSVPPGVAHSTAELVSIASSGSTPFTSFFKFWLKASRGTFDHALISLAYLSQLPAAVELAWILEQAGIKVTVGGSLASALKNTGSGIELLQNCFREIAFDDGRSLTGENQPFLSKLEWPVFAKDWKYFSSRPVIPFPLTTGCTWNKCLFCPDRDKPFMNVSTQNLGKILSRGPDNPIIHLIDSEIPARALDDMLPLLREKTSGFYGFARPQGEWLKNDLLQRAADSGCLMLQTGAESGSSRILTRFMKGFSPETAEQVITKISDSGIRNYVYLLFGLPGETESDRKLTLSMIRRLKGKIDYMNLSVFNLPEKCELTERASEFGIVPGRYDADASVLRFYRPFMCLDGSNPRAEAREFI
ncbi:MAG: radical SAM protein, partial [bacterium]|nr:radical SAM protein [bacterium]